MLSSLFLAMALVGSEWVLYLLLILSIVSIALIIERFRFYRTATQDLEKFRMDIRAAAVSGQWEQALKVSHARANERATRPPDFESRLSTALIQHHRTKNASGNTSSAASTPEILSEIAHDSIARTRLEWERNLAILATIGNNAPFVGLFGTVLGIIQAFHHLATTGGGGASTVTAGISEALIATAVGIMVAIPAVVAYNLYQRRVRTALTEAEALRSFLIGKIAGNSS